MTHKTYEIVHVYVLQTVPMMSPAYHYMPIPLACACYMRTYFGSGFSSFSLYTTNLASVLYIQCIYFHVRVRGQLQSHLYLHCTCTNVYTSAAFSDVVYKHENALYLGPQPIPPAPFDPDHCRHEIADFYRHHIRPPGEPILIPLLQNTHSISHHCPRYLSLSLVHRTLTPFEQ